MARDFVATGLAVRFLEVVFPLFAVVELSVAESRKSHQAFTTLSMSRFAALASAILPSFITRLVSPPPVSSGCLPGICAPV